MQNTALCVRFVLFATAFGIACGGAETSGNSQATGGGGPATGGSSSGGYAGTGGGAGLNGTGGATSGAGGGVADGGAADGGDGSTETGLPCGSTSCKAAAEYCAWTNNAYRCLALDRFPCGTNTCDLTREYCRLDVTTFVYECVALPASCLGAALTASGCSPDTPCCRCFDSDPCGDVCSGSVRGAVTLACGTATGSLCALPEGTHCDTPAAECCVVPKPPASPPSQLNTGCRCVSGRVQCVTSQGPGCP
jgi:hypothetical protein